MAFEFTSYSTLKSAVASEIHRDDLTSGGEIAGFIQLAESKMKRKLRTADMDVSTTLTTSSGSETVNLPTGFVRMRRAQLLYGGAYSPLPIVGLESVSTVSGAPPKAIAVKGNALVVSPKPDGAYTIPIDCSVRFTSLSTANPTNWILSDYPDAYLYGAAAHSMPWMGADGRLNMYAQLFLDVIEDINSEHARKMHGQAQLVPDVPANYSTYNIHTDR